VLRAAVCRSGTTLAVILLTLIGIALAAGRLSAQAGRVASTPASQATAPVPQAAAVPPAFDVSTVKPSKPEQMGSMLQLTDDGISITHFPLHTILCGAFGTEDDHILDEPGWSRSAMFDIEAKVAPEDAPKLKGLSRDQRYQMLVPLLEERFGLKFHHETRELPVYTLVVAKGGIKMQQSKPDDSSGPGRKMLMARKGHIESADMDIRDLAHVLSQQLGRTVVDETGLTGKYDYKLDWTPDDAPPPMAASGAGGQQQSTLPDASGPSLFTALQEQLGLKLETKKAMSDVIVIDHIEQPSAN